MNTEDAIRAIPKDVKKALFINKAGAKTVVTLNKTELDKWYKKGYSFGKVDTPMGSKHGSFDFVVQSSKKERKPLANTVVESRVGWVDRINKDRLYYVKSSQGGSRNGEGFSAFDKNSRIKTLHAFNTEQEALAYVSTVEKKGGQELKVTFDRELEATGIQLDHSSRSGDGVFMGSNNSQMPLLDPLHSGALGLKKTASIVTKAEWSVFKRDEWLKSAKKAFPTQLKGMDFEGAGARVKSLTTAEGSDLTRLHEEIKNWSGIHTFEETFLGQQLQSH